MLVAVGAHEAERAVAALDAAGHEAVLVGAIRGRGPDQPAVTFV